jgi:hypothetical protein
MVIGGSYRRLINVTSLANCAALHTLDLSEHPQLVDLTSLSSCTALSPH